MWYGGMGNPSEMASVHSGKRPSFLRYQYPYIVFRLWWRDAKLSELPPAPWPRSQSDAEYEFAYPTNFTPVPSHSPLTFQYLLDTVIPLAGETNQLEVQVPPPNPQFDVDDMVIESAPIQRSIALGSDGILLYHGEASYEPGTSPLSLWIPGPPSIPSSQEENHLQRFAA
jgi:hypothetical protein